MLVSDSNLLDLQPPKTFHHLVSLFPVVMESLWFVTYFQLGLGHTNHVREPTLVTVLQGKNIRQISAGRCHSAAWTAPPVPPRAPGEAQNVLAFTVLFPTTPHCWMCMPVLNVSIVGLKPSSIVPHPDTLAKACISSSGRCVGASATGPAWCSAPPVRGSAGGEHSHRACPTSPALPLLWPHVLLLEAAEPQPQQPGNSCWLKIGSPTSRGFPSASGKFCHSWCFLYGHTKGSRKDSCSIAILLLLIVLLETIVIKEAWQDRHVMYFLQSHMWFQSLSTEKTSSVV